MCVRELELERGSGTRARTIREEHLSHCMGLADGLIWGPRSAWMCPASGRVHLGRLGSQVDGRAAMRSCYLPPS